MENDLKRKRAIVQWVVVLLTGMLAGTVLITPVGAHIGSFNHLKTKHFYTKKAADQRFVDNGELQTQLANLPGPKIYAANVNASGVMLGSVPAGATSSRTGTGQYTVSFQRPITGCVISSSLASAGPGFDFGETTVLPFPGNPNALRVATATSSGVFVDQTFAVQMVCP
jgi:hypothetical protein